MLSFGAIIFFVCFTGLAFANAHKILRFESPLGVDTPFEDYNRNFYADERESYSLSTASIDSYFQKGSLLRLKLRKSSFTRQAFDSDAAQVLIDGKRVTIKKVRDFRGKEYETAYLLFIDLKDVKADEEHLLSFIIEKDKMPSLYESGGYEFKIEIPFYKE